MEITVFVRPVHNLSKKIQPTDCKGIAELRGYDPIPNPYDEVALEYALRLKGQTGFKVTVVCVGSGAAQNILRELLACGADDAVLLEEENWEPDGKIVAERLASYYEDHRFMIGLFGHMDVDTCSGQVGPMFSALTGTPYLDSVIDLHLEEDRLIVLRKRKKRRERIMVAMPCCLGILRGPSLRYHSFPLKIKAERMEITRIKRTGTKEQAVYRIRFTGPKPGKRSLSFTTSADSHLEKIQQAFGIKGKDRAGSESSIIRGDVQEASRKVAEIILKEGLLFE